MPIYEFESADGRRLERFYEMRRAPRVGKTIRVRGVEYRRVPSWESVTVRPKPDHAHVSSQIAGFHPAAPRHVGPLGKAAFANDREIREFCAKTGYAYDGLTNKVDGAHDSPSNNLDEYWQRAREAKVRFQRAQEIKYALEQHEA